MTVICKSYKETISAGENLGKTLRGGDIVLLDGDLGAGKTTFTKGIAKALLVKEEILSPTFTIMNEYAGESVKLCHFDAYRLKNGEEAVFAGLAEPIGDKNTICVIEWFENISDILPKKNIVKVNIKYKSQTVREIEINVDK